MQQSALVPTQKQAFFEPRRLAHTNLYVTDLDTTMRFYTEVVGLEEVYRTPLAGGGFVSNGSTHHDLGFITANGPGGRPRQAKAGQLNHLGFELETESALVEGYERARASGEKFLRTADHDIAHSVYGSDPDANTYELYADVVTDWRSQRSGTVTKAKPIWTPGSTPPIEQPMYHPSPALKRTESAVFHPERTTGAAIVTGRLQEMSRYYEEMVGLRVVSRGSDGNLAVLAGTTGEPCLTLIQASGSQSVGYHHVSMVVADAFDLEDSVKRAMGQGLPIVADANFMNRRAVTLRDPDDFLIQFYCDQGGVVNPDLINRELALQLL
ncbi:VOC family protein [Paraburkholderia caribensis]|uniref:VOC family protein n=1 Tax=Paraburkholderia caribensis TaxID=75105 RepID=UPI00078D2C4D|nr:VOC family protein [Paraburkholderia caribensis]AMV48468.1 hypothetical protein ATN79_48345 [Paraburkholderia caribensis]